MAFLHFGNIGIASLACAVPEYVQEIIEDPALVHAGYMKSFVRKIGIRQRRVSLIEQTSTDLGYAAIEKALDKAGWTPQSLDALIFLSQMPDFNPGTGNAFVLHRHLGLPHSTFAFDVTLGCSSFPYGLSICASYLQQEGIQRVAMVSGDNVWSSAPGKEALLGEKAFLFGEGTTAMLLEKRENSPVDIALYTDGSHYEYLFNPTGGFRNNWRDGDTITLTSGQSFPVSRSSKSNIMDGPEVTIFSTTTVVDSIKEFLDKTKTGMDSYDGLVLHQANKQIVGTIARRLGADPARVPMSLDRYANTSGASVPLTIADAYGGKETGHLKLLTCAYGIGLSWGIASFELDTNVVLPIFATNTRFDEGYVNKS